MSFAKSKLVGFVVLILVSHLLAQSNDTLAQSKVEIGEEVKVLILGSWLDGLIVDKDKKKLLIEYTWVGTAKQKVYERHQVRRLYEVGAMDYGRNWESVNGTFKIDAALKDVIGDEVLLVKLDLTEIQVPLAKLCTRDNNYVNKLKKNHDRAVTRGEIPAVTPKLPEIESFEAGFADISTFNHGLSKQELAPLGPIPSYLTEFTQAGMGFNMIRKGQKLVAVIPVGGPEQLVLMTAREDNFHNRGTRFQSQVYWVSLKTKKVLSAVAITPEDHPVDYDPQNKLLLTFHRENSRDKTGEPDHYTLWKMNPKDSSAQPLVRWEAKGVSWAKNIFAKIVNERIVVGKTESQTYVAWDVVDKKTVYSVKSKSFFDAPIVISPDRRHLIFSEGKQVSVIDAATGELEFGADVDDRHVSGANINPDGTKLAALTERNIYVWDLASGAAEPTIYPAPLMGSPFSSRVEWIDDDHILGQSSRNRILYRLSLRLPVWSYHMDVRDYFQNRDPMKNLVVNGKFFYVSKPDPFSSAIAVGAVDLPGPSVAEVTQNIDRDSLMILKPGVHVGLAIGSVADRSKVERWLSEKVEQNQWVLDDTAEIKIHAEMGIGETQTVKYSRFGAGGGDVTEVSFRPHFANLKIKKGKTVIWQTGTSTGPPSMISGNNIQRELGQYQKPQLEFFKGVSIDGTIIDPKYSRGFGVSSLGLRGIQVVSTTPPGREDDPLAASLQADEDQQKAIEESQQESAAGDDPKTEASDAGGGFGGCP